MGMCAGCTATTPCICHGQGMCGHSTIQSSHTIPACENMLLQLCCPGSRLLLIACLEHLADSGGAWAAGTDQGMPGA